MSHVFGGAARVAAAALALWMAVAVHAGAERAANDPAEAWVERTLAGMTLDQKIGQLIVPSFLSMYTSTDSDTFDELAALVRDYHVGGFHVFGGREPVPAVLLNPASGGVVLGQPLAAASLINRLQALAAVPLLNSADFEAGIGFRLSGGTMFPRVMAFGAAGDERLVYEAARITALEGRAVGVHVNFAPVVDVNNNPRNPVINTRAFGEDPDLVARMGAEYVRGLQGGGMTATLKHFPGHGDTDVDTHLGLATILHPRERLNRIELPPFRAGMAAGAGAVMTGHIELPEIDPAEGRPSTFSGAITTDLLRGELGFDGLIYTDSMSMHAVAQMLPPGEAAVQAVKAGHDLVLHSPDDIAVFNALREAVASGELRVDRIDASVRRILQTKAQLGLHVNRLVDLEAIPEVVGTRAHAAVAREVSERAITLVKDDRGQIPLAVAPDASILYLSVLDYPSGWRIAAPSRTLLPELRRRWRNVTAIELSDHTSLAELALVRATASRYDAIVAGVFVRTSSFSGRMDLAETVGNLLQDLARITAASGTPYAVVLFGNPYIASQIPELPAVLLTYDFYDLAEASAVRALAGEIPIVGRLPIALPDAFPAGHGLGRAPVTLTRQ